MVTDYEYVCSGTFISPTVFIIAAHCFEEPGQEVFITVDPDGFAEDSTFVSGNWYPDSEFCIQCTGGLVGFDTHDIAVVILDEPISLSSYAQLPSAGLVDRLAMDSEWRSSATASRTPSTNSTPVSSSPGTGLQPNWCRRTAASPLSS